MLQGCPKVKMKRKMVREKNKKKKNNGGRLGVGQKHRQHDPSQFQSGEGDAGGIEANKNFLDGLRVDHMVFWAMSLIILI